MVIQDMEFQCQAQKIKLYFWCFYDLIKCFDFSKFRGTGQIQITHFLNFQSQFLCQYYHLILYENSFLFINMWRIEKFKAKMCSIYITISTSTSVCPSTVGQNGSVASLKSADSWLGFSFCTCSKGPRTLFKKIFGVAQQFLWTD